MSKLMRHTKAELVEMIEELEKDSEQSQKTSNKLEDEVQSREKKYQDLQSRCAGLEEEISSRKKEHDQQKENLENEIQRKEESRQDLQRRLEQAEKEKFSLNQERDDLKKDNTLLHEKLDQFSRDKANLNKQFALLEKDFQELQNRHSSCTEQYHTNQELFKLFVDNSSQKIMLLDTAYTFQFINSGALEMLGLSDSDRLMNRKIFDFFAYDDALKLKEKIDKAFLRGEKEKVKDIKFQNGNGNPVKLKMKIARVRYEDRPSVKLKLK